MNSDTQEKDAGAANEAQSNENQALQNVASEPEFYKKSQNYWSQIPATVNGMLGGLGYISATDIQGSKKFLRELRLKGKKIALDCGAGIGRVTKNLLMPLFDEVDMVEQDTNFANSARSYCTENTDVSLVYHRLGEIYNVGLQKFTPEATKYDLIWSQWVLGYLTDDDLLDFFRRIQSGLKDGGYFVLKDNVTSNQKTEIDETDSSVTRPLKTYEQIIRKSGLRIVKTTRQQGFPKGLYAVYMIACQPQKF